MQMKLAPKSCLSNPYIDSVGALNFVMVIFEDTTG